jgi:glycosyltransferase involved in cell wall biosynthesis
MRLVLVTQTLDPEHAALAQTLDLVGALAARCDELVVLCRVDRWRDPPTNVAFRTFDAASKAGRAVVFERALAGSLPADAVLVHMVPTFAVLAAPLARLRRTPLLLWYTHWHASPTLRLAAPLCDLVLSVDRTTFPLDRPNVRGIGHAIDVQAFAGGPPRPHDGPLRLLAAGRTARWKGLPTLLDALAVAVAEGLDATLEIRGPSLTDDERAHRAELQARIGADAAIAGRAALLEPVPRRELPALLAAADVFVSPAEPRSGATLDKAVYEAAACARPVVTSNAALAPFLEGLPLPLLVPPRDPRALADALVRLGAAEPATLAEVGAELRRRVVAGHSLEHWVDAVVTIVTEVRSARGKAASDGEQSA